MYTFNSTKPTQTKKPKEVMKKSDIKKVQIFEGRKDSCTQFEVAFYDKKETWMLKALSEVSA